MLRAPDEPTAEHLARSLRGVRSGSGWHARCPAHADDKASLAISTKNGRTVFKCHAGCSQDAVLDSLRASGHWPAKGTKAQATPKAPIVATYDYCNEVGELVFQVVRYQSKKFRQRRRPRPGDPPDKVCSWVWSVEGVRVVPYRLPELLEALSNQRTLFVVEGERDVQTLAKLGIPATCNAGGALKWRAEHAKFLQGADVVVVPDNDEAGRRHADMVASSLTGIAKRVRVLMLPDLADKEDVSDWIKAGGTAEQLWQLAESAPDWKLSAVPEPTPQIETLPPCSDETLATEFVKRHGSVLRYTDAWGHWHHFDGQRWSKIETLLHYNFARVVCREAAAQAKNPSEAKDTASARKRAAVVSLAREDRTIAATTDQWDRDVWLLNTPGGTIDLQTFEVRKHSATDYISRMTAVTPGGKCPRWLQFLDEILRGDQELAGFLKRMAGYALTGATSEHALFFLYGTGGNGKGVFLNTLIGILNDYHRGAPIDTFTASKTERHSTELAMLRGARLVTATETEEGRGWAEAKIKLLTGGDRITAQFMRQDNFEYTPRFKLVIAGNHKPSLRTVDEAIRRRLHLVPFTVTITAEKRDLTLAEKLKEEWPGILQWALDGCAEWRERGLQPPQAVTAATAAYLQNEDAFAAWQDECCEHKGEELQSTLYSSWKVWCERNGEPPRSNKWFGGKLDHFENSHTNKGKQVNGLRLIQSDEQQPKWYQP